MNIQKAIKDHMGESMSAGENMELLDIEAQIEMDLEHLRNSSRQCPDCGTVRDQSVRKCPKIGCKFDQGRMVFEVAK